MLEPQPVASGERLRIVLAEDDPAVRRSLQLLLRGRGFEVKTYGSGGALLADAQSRSAACFIADYRLPDMDGFQVLKALRAEGWGGPAVLVTAFHSPDLAQRALLEGFKVVIEKPLHERVLVDAVTRLFA